MPTLVHFHPTPTIVPSPRSVEVVKKGYLCLTFVTILSPGPESLSVPQPIGNKQEQVKEWLYSMEGLTPTLPCTLHPIPHRIHMLN